MKITKNRLRQIIRESIENMAFPEENPLEMKFIVYGLGDKLDMSKINDNITNNFAFRNNKPYGGLWGAPLKNNGGSEWGDFVQTEIPTRLKSLSSHVIFTLKPNAKIYTINDREDVKKMPWLEDNSKYGRYVAVDWEKLQKMGYDGVYLTNKGNYELHDTYGGNFPMFNFWDLASICVFNKDIINIENEDIYDYDKNAGNYEDSSKLPRWYRGEEKLNDYKDLQIDKMYKRYGNLNIEPDMSNFFNGKHPGIIAQDNSEEGEKMRNFKGRLK